MIELLRNCSHGSQIATYLVNNESGMKNIIKVASTPGGIENLKSEIAGWNWYQNIRYPLKKYPICQIIQQKNNYLKIKIEFIDGFKADYRKGLEKNAGLIKKVVENYFHIWPFYPNNISSLHGDLSLDNIIYNSNGVHIIDWEHFTLKGAPWGFDVIYLLFETLYFGMRNRKRPSQKEISIIVDNITFLNSNNQLHPRMIEHPLKFIKDFITDNQKLWGEQLIAFPNKFPIIAFTNDQISLIDNMIFSKLKEKI